MKIISILLPFLSALFVVCTCYSYPEIHWNEIEPEKAQFLRNLFHHAASARPVAETSKDISLEEARNADREPELGSSRFPTTARQSQPASKSLSSEESEENPETQSSNPTINNDVPSQENNGSTPLNTTAIKDITVINNDIEIDVVPQVMEQDGNGVHFDTESELQGFMTLTKTIRANKVEEVFEDLEARNSRRVVTENRFEKVQLSRNNHVVENANENDFRNMFFSF